MIIINVLNYADITFLSILKKYGLLRFIISTEMLFSVGILVGGKIAHIVPFSMEVEKQFYPLTSVFC